MPATASLPSVQTMRSTERSSREPPTRFKPLGRNALFLNLLFLASWCGLLSVITSTAEGFVVSKINRGLARPWKAEQIEQRSRRQFGLKKLRAGASAEWSFSAVGKVLDGRGMEAGDVMTWRHDKIGTALELWQGSFGWFDYTAADGEPIVLCDTWAVQVTRPTEEFVMPSLYLKLREAAQRGEQAAYKITDPVEAGVWTAEEAGDYVLIRNKYSKRQDLILTDDGFVFLGSRSQAVRVSQGKAEELLVTEALQTLPGLQLRN